MVPCSDHKFIGLDKLWPLLSDKRRCGHDDTMSVRREQMLMNAKRTVYKR